jgi:BMFP domain-containing protein YqiC
MADPKTLFDDLSRVAGSAFDTALSWRESFLEQIQTHFENWLIKADMVRREEFEIVREMAQKALEENEKLRARITELEQKKS